MSVLDGYREIDVSGQIGLMMAKEWQALMLPQSEIDRRLNVEWLPPGTIIIDEEIDAAKLTKALKDMGRL